MCLEICFVHDVCKGYSVVWTLIGLHLLGCGSVSQQQSRKKDKILKEAWYCLRTRMLTLCWHAPVAPCWTQHGLVFFVVILMIQTPVCSRSYSHQLVTSSLCPERQFSLRHLLPYLSRWLLPTCHGLGRLGRCSSKAEKKWENLCTSFIIFPHLSLKSASWSQFSEGTQEDCLWQMFPFSRFLFAVC